MWHIVLSLFFFHVGKNIYTKAYVALYSHSLQREGEGDIHCLIDGSEDVVCPFNGLVSSHEKGKC